MTDYFNRLQKEIISQGICTHCGSCVGLSLSKVQQKETINGVLPHANNPVHDKLIYDICPGRKINFLKLNEFVFPNQPKDYVLGNFQQGYVGHITDPKIRTNGASAGVITGVLIYLLKNKYIDGAVVLKHGSSKPWLSEPIIATSEKEILESAQSVYIPVMTNSILDKTKSFKGKLAFVGLPDQVAVIRKLQLIKHQSVSNIEYIIGPYVGTAIYLEAIKSFLRANGIKKIDDVTLLKYRDGEWPGYLRVDTKDGQSFKAEKFYYNYLIPFYITQASLYSIDFANELTDISVGDAWNPQYEDQKQGFSVVLGRTKKGMKILQQMKKKKLISLEKKEREVLINMHGHMIDFKKRGSFIRMKWRKFFGKPVPSYDYHPAKIALSRYLVEIIISGLFFFGRINIIRIIVEKIPVPIIGKLFNMLRLSWKNISRSTKRKGIGSIKFIENPLS